MSERILVTPDERTHDVRRWAGALLAAARSWTMYPSDHPVVSAAVNHFSDVVRELTVGAVLSVGVTPETLLFDGTPVDAGDGAVAEAARVLHNCDLLQLTFFGDLPPDAIRQLLRMITLDGETRRQQGGPTAIWAMAGHPSIELIQINYADILSGDESKVAAPAKRDELWSSIVGALAGAASPCLGDAEQQRLFGIAGSTTDLAELIADLVSSRCTADGSPMVTSQAATVRLALQRLANIAAATAVDRLPHIVSTMAAAVLQLDPHVLLEFLHSCASEDTPIANRLANAFDDQQLAQLLASTISIDGGVSDRLAAVFQALTPDAANQQRVVALAGTLLGETAFGRSQQFDIAWESAQSLLLRYDDRPFASPAYRGVLGGVGPRAATMVGNLPPEASSWLETISPGHIRSLSVTLLIDLLALEADASRAVDLVREMEGIAEDLMRSGAYPDARRLTEALRTRGEAAGAPGSDACLRVLDRLGESVAMRELSASLEDLDDADWPVVRQIILTTGVSTVESLKSVVIVEEPTRASQRAEEVVVAFAAASVARLRSLAADSRWFAQRQAARLLGRVAAPEGVPLLRDLLRHGDSRAIGDTVRALCAIQDASAARVLHLSLRSATGDRRRMMIDTLVADHDARVVPTIGRLLEDSRPLGKDHSLALEMLAALGLIGSDEAVPTLAAMSARRAFFRRRKLKTIKAVSVHALQRIGGPKAEAALLTAARTGDPLLRSIVASSIGGTRGRL